MADALYSEYQEAANARKEAAIRRMEARGDVKMAEQVRSQRSCFKTFDDEEAGEIEQTYDQNKMGGASASAFVATAMLDVGERQVAAAKAELVQESVDRAAAEQQQNAAASAAAANQWTTKHISEDHDEFWRREWADHVRNCNEASPYWYERQEEEARRVAAKMRERQNATSGAYGYHYRGEQQASTQEPFHYPFHHTQVQRTVDDHMSVYDKRYGHCRMMPDSQSMPVTFLKHRNPRLHISQGLPRSGSRCAAAMGGPNQASSAAATQCVRSQSMGLSAQAGFVHSREPSGSDRAASAAYGVYH